MTRPDPAFLVQARLLKEELFRVLCDEPPMGQSLALKPVPGSFVGRPDALEFLRGVPTGTSLAELERLGSAYCARIRSLARAASRRSRPVSVTARRSAPAS